MRGGVSIVEDIVTNDAVDVLEDGDGSLVICRTEIEPGDGAEMMSPGVAGALQGLHAHLEG